MEVTEGKERVQMFSAQIVLFWNTFDITVESADGEGRYILWVSLCCLGMWVPVPPEV